jgi:hypothetical protein
MDVKSWLRFFYPGLANDTVNTQFLEYRIGLIVSLSLSCSLCTLIYVSQGTTDFKIYCICLSVYFLVLPTAMKFMGKWRLFGFLCCTGWLTSNLVIGNSLPKETIGLNFFQSLIPSYLLLATEDYRFSTMAAMIIGLISMPYQYDNVYDKIISLEDNEIKPYVIFVLNNTKTLNRYHLIASFGLTVWMSICKQKEINLMKALKEAAEQAKKSTETFFAAFSHEFRNPLNA